MRVFHKQIRDKDVINILSKAPSHQRFDLMLNEWMIAVKLIKELEVKEEIKVVEDHSLLVYKKFSLNGAWLVWHNWGKFISFLILGSAILYIVNVKTKIQSLYNDYIKK